MKKRSLLSLCLLLGCNATNPAPDGGGGGGGSQPSSSVSTASASTSSTSSASTGGSSSSSGGGGAGGKLDGPIDRGTILVLEFDSLYFEVQPSLGARISALRFGGTDLLTNAMVNAMN